MIPIIYGWLTVRRLYTWGHHRFLPIRHAVRKKGKHFKGQADHRTKLMHRSGEDVFNMLKDLKVIFGKGPGSQLVPNENRMAPMWKKKSIFWELSYWEVLDIRHAIDVMHLTKNLLRQPDSILGSLRKDKRYTRSTSRIATYGRTRCLTSTIAR